jgi:hypothetical protein
LIKRRDKITSTYLTAVNPIVAPRLEANGRLTFENAAIAAGVANGPATYRASWLRFDHATGETQALSETQGSTTTIEARAAADGAGQFQQWISPLTRAYLARKQPVRIYFRRDGASWKLVDSSGWPKVRHWIEP